MGTTTNNNEGGESGNRLQFSQCSDTLMRSNHQRNTSRKYFSFEVKSSDFKSVLGMRKERSGEKYRYNNFE